MNHRKSQTCQTFPFSQAQPRVERRSWLGLTIFLRDLTQICALFYVAITPSKMSESHNQSLSLRTQSLRSDSVWPKFSERLDFIKMVLSFCVPQFVFFYEGKSHGVRSFREVIWEEVN
jgi:hypothetical protein